MARVRPGVVVEFAENLAIIRAISQRRVGVGPSAANFLD